MPWYEQTVEQRVRACLWYADQYDECVNYWVKQPPTTRRDYQLERHRRHAADMRRFAEEMQRTGMVLA